MPGVDEQRAGKSGSGVAALIGAAVLIAAPFAAGFEGLRTKPYRDPVGIPTVCFGDTAVEMRVYSADECGQLLRERMRRDYAPRVLACLPELAQPDRARIFAALIDASYNAGPAAVCRSPMARAVRAGELRRACDAFRGWYVTAGGKRLRGLERRREAERALCLQDVAKPSPAPQRPALFQAEESFCDVPARPRGPLFPPPSGSPWLDKRKPGGVA